jgi:crotonobetainyl-CoA:carnitine CoA-transferase CaiB-like acyl-CoA transferase
MSHHSTQASARSTQHAALLAGLRVLECSEGIAVGYAGKLLVELGAEVIKVERPRVGDRLRHHGPFPGDVPHREHSGLYLYLHVNKRGITLNLECATGKTMLQRLAATVDVVLESFLPGHLARLGLGFEELQACNSGLILTSISPFGQTGPYARTPAYDITVCAAAGITYSVGTPEHEPLTPPLFQSAYQAGMGGAAATMAALLARSSIGIGQHADVSALEIFATIHSGGTALTFLYLGETGRRSGNRRPDLYPYVMLPCRDGYVCLIAREGRQWRRFLEVLGHPAWAEEPRYRDRRAMAEQYAEEVDALLAPWLMAHTKEEIFALCRAHRIPFAPVRTVAEVVADKQARARGFFVALHHPALGRLTFPGPPYCLGQDGTRHGPPRLEPAPRLGEHNEQIYGGWMGMSREELMQLYRAGIV